MNSEVPGETRIETRKSKRTTPDENEESGGQKEIGCYKKTVRFLIHAPDAEEVHLAGDFNSWNPHALSLRRKERGFWEAVIKLPPGHHKYKFFIDGEWVYRIPGAVQIEDTCVQDIPAAQVLPNPFGSMDCLLVVN